MPSFVAVIIAQNAASLIVDVVEALNWADDLRVIDLHSTDHTALLAQQHGATVQPWVGTVPPIVEAVRLIVARSLPHDYILFADQDEIHQGTRPSIERHIREDTRTHLAFRFRNHIFRRKALYSELTPARLFHRESFLTGKSPGMHGPTEALVAKEGWVEHYPFLTLGAWRKKWNRYCSEEANALTSTPWELSIVRDLVKAPLTQLGEIPRKGDLFGAVLFHAFGAYLVVKRPIVACTIRLPSSVRFGSWSERPWGWGERFPSSR